MSNKSGKAPETQNPETREGSARDMLGKLSIESVKTTPQPRQSSPAVDVSPSSFVMGDKRKQPSAVKALANDSTTSSRMCKQPLESADRLPFAVKSGCNICPSSQYRREQGLKCQAHDLMDRTEFKFSSPIPITNRDHMKFTRQCTTVQLADSLTRAAAQATALAQELIEKQDTNAVKTEETYKNICNVEKQLGDAQKPIKELIVFEKEYAQALENINKNIEFLKARVKQLVHDGDRALQECAFSIMCYVRKYKQFPASHEAQEAAGKSETPGNVSNRAMEMETGKAQQQNDTAIDNENSLPELRGLNLSIQAARAANPNFTVHTGLNAGGNMNSEGGDMLPPAKRRRTLRPTARGWNKKREGDWRPNL